MKTVAVFAQGPKGFKIGGLDGALAPEHPGRRFGVCNMKKIGTATASPIDEEEYAHTVRCDSSDEMGERFFTPKEAAAYLRASKSYVDKLRVYGGGPKFVRFTKRKILYRKSDLDLWTAQHRFGSTSEYESDRISPNDVCESPANIKQQRATKTLGYNSS